MPAYEQVKSSISQSPTSTATGCAYGWNRASARKIAKLCSPQTSCRPCGPLGASIALLHGSFPAGMAPSRWHCQVVDPTAWPV